MHWTVRFLLSVAAEKEISINRIEIQAGICRNTIYRWQKTGRTPDLNKIDRALTVVGYRLTIAPITEGDK